MRTNAAYSDLFHRNASFLIEVLPYLRDSCGVLRYWRHTARRGRRNAMHICCVLAIASSAVSGRS
jgi:hypothetical protein